MAQEKCYKRFDMRYVATSYMEVLCFLELLLGVMSKLSAMQTDLHALAAMQDELAATVPPRWLPVRVASDRVHDLLARPFSLAITLFFHRLHLPYSCIISLNVHALSSFLFRFVHNFVIIFLKRGPPREGFCKGIAA